MDIAFMLVGLAIFIILTGLLIRDTRKMTKHPLHRCGCGHLDEAHREETDGSVSFMWCKAGECRCLQFTLVSIEYEPE